MASELIVI